MVETTQQTSEFRKFQSFFRIPTPLKESGMAQGELLFYPVRSFVNEFCDKVSILLVW